MTGPGLSNFAGESGGRDAGGKASSSAAVLLLLRFGMKALGDDFAGDFGRRYRPESQKHATGPKLMSKSMRAWPAEFLNYVFQY